MAEINKEFLDDLEKEFNSRYSSNKKIQTLVKNLRNSKATAEDAFEYAKEVGNLRKNVLHDCITDDVLNNEYLGYSNASTLFNDVLYKDYELINQYCKNAFTQVNKKAGINLNGISTEYDQNKTDGIIECAVKGPYETVRAETEEAVYTHAKCCYDTSVKRNVEFQGKSGLNPVIIRTAVGKTCKWCQSLAGTYNYLDDWDPYIYDNVYRRHSNCDCMVVYSPKKGKYQDVWSKSWADDKQYEEEKARRIEYSENKKNLDPVKLAKNKFSNHLDPVIVRSEKVESLKGYDDVFIHGDEIGFAYKDSDGNEHSISVKEFSDILIKYGKFENDKIRLCSCGTGAPNAIAAQKLADYTGKEVLAPSTTLWILPENNLGKCDMIVADEDEAFPDLPDYSKLGEWITFKPNRKG